MNIKRAKEEIQSSIEAYLKKDAYGEYMIPAIRQRPILLMGPPGIGKTQIMEQIARECQIGLVAYTITHHTRQSAIGLPFISEKKYDGMWAAMSLFTSILPISCTPKQPILHQQIFSRQYYTPSTFKSLIN